MIVRLCDSWWDADNFYLEGTHVFSKSDFPREDGRLDEGAETCHHLYGDGVSSELDVFVHVAWVLKYQVKATMVTAGSQPVGCELLGADLDVDTNGLEDVFLRM